MNIYQKFWGAPKFYAEESGWFFEGHQCWLIHTVAARYDTLSYVRLGALDPVSFRRSFKDSPC